MMNDLTWAIQLFIWIPLLGFLVSLALPARKEWIISRSAHGTAALQLLLAIVFVILWVNGGFKALNLKEFSLFKSEGYEFLIDFYFDKVTAVYLLVGALLTFLITVYSRFYLHREKGYKGSLTPFCSFIWDITSPFFRAILKRFLLVGRFWEFHLFC
jgi:NADH-quinone oxidoreductase subunit L